MLLFAKTEFPDQLVKSAAEIPHPRNSHFSYYDIMDTNNTCIPFV